MRGISYIVSSRNANWIGYIWRRKCLLKICYCRKDKGKDRGDEKTRKKTQVSTRSVMGKLRPAGQMPPA